MLRHQSVSDDHYQFVSNEKEYNEGKSNKLIGYITLNMHANPSYFNKNILIKSVFSYAH